MSNISKEIYNDLKNMFRMRELNTNNAGQTLIISEKDIKWHNINCKSCGANEYKHNKCTYCGSIR